MAQTVGQRSASEASAQGRGLRVIALLAALTLVEYVIAISIDSPAVLLTLLSGAALVKAWFIVIYFMHLPLLWHNDGGH